MENLVAPCGTYCGECKGLGNISKGCTQLEGKPYWIVKTNMAICPQYDCCINKKRIEHCGLCGEFPCQLFRGSDPALSAEEAEKEVVIRRNNLLHRKAVGTVKWLSEKATSHKK
jgi:hypothetical protein